MRASLPAILSALVLALAFPVTAQEGNETPVSNETAPTNETTPTNETPAANETPTNETPADEGPPEPVQITLEGRGEGGAFFFNIEGQTQRNPTLTFAPGTEVTLTLKTVSGAVHNWCTDVTGEKLCTKLVGEGEEDTITFTVPEGAQSTTYWCDPHRGSGMQGRLAVGTATGGGAPTGSTEQFQGATVDLGDLGYPQCAGTKIPAATANGAVGGPTVADYVERCSTTTEEKVDPHKSADYVIPASFALIGLGVLGAVWVHRRYQP